MSHLTKLTTTICDQNMLEITLSDLGLNWNKRTSHLSNKPDYIIKQSNDIDLYFAWQDNAYTLTTDLQFWRQSSPVELFLDKLNQRYAYNLIKRKGSSHGFTSVKESLNNQGSIKLTFRRWS
uniref:Uncharacterized protein ycf35 n=1 Tax=Porphyridium purpureum TaxID=35688 RepID=W0RYU1_PORPP|nr:conserved hypothetical plastid protein [Porphyridium purpureum]ATJ02968.1 hypothetical protein [Porphyridium purpureum]BAO23751.1 conserved hypothetical plastid protein [Porphyridium purpureum]